MGSLDVLNDMGNTGRATGEVLRTVDSICKVSSGHSCDETPIQPSNFNILLGQLKQFSYEAFRK
jgi:hypothetical protein